MYAIAQAYGMLAAGLAQRALVVGGDVLSRILDWTRPLDAHPLRRRSGRGRARAGRASRGFLGFELGADGGGGNDLSLPGSGSRSVEGATGRVLPDMNGREVFKFATRVLVSSAEAVLDDAAGQRWTTLTSTFPPGKRPDHRTRGQEARVTAEKIVVNVDRYGNTSSGSIPLALAEAQADGRLKEGDLVLMTGMGAGLTWGSALMEWTQ